MVDTVHQGAATQGVVTQADIAPAPPVITMITGEVTHLEEGIAAVEVTVVEVALVEGADVTQAVVVEVTLGEAVDVTEHL